MPTVLRKRGWRFFFYSNEGIEPPHIHARKAGMECKFWLDPRTREFRPAHLFKLSPRDLREVNAILEEHFDDLMAAWNHLQQDPRT